MFSVISDKYDGNSLIRVLYVPFLYLYRHYGKDEILADAVDIVKSQLSIYAFLVTFNIRGTP